VSRPIRLVALILCGVLGVSATHGLAQTLDGSQVVTPFRIFAVVWRGETEVEQGFRDYLTQRGIPFEMTVRNLNLDRGNAPPIVDEIKRVRPDLVYTWGTGTTLSIVGKLETDTPESFVRDIPAVFTLVSYPKAANVVESYESTGRPVTGVSFLAPVEAQLKTILAYRPFTNIAVIYDRTAGNSRINVADLREAAPRMGIHLIELPVPLRENGKSDPAALPGLVEQAKADGAELLYMGPDSFLTRHAKAYTAAALAAGLPTFASTQAPLKNSRAMFGLVTDYHTLGKLTALQAERILVEKRRPEDLPVARLARYKLWINMDVMRELGMYPPMDMIAIADFKTSSGG
jgi:putative ABC transport system substrate-binding protein